MADVTKVQSRFPHGIRENLTTLAKSDDATLTQAEVLSAKVVTQSGATKTITFPAAAAIYKGVSLIVASIHASAADNKVVVAAGFNGGGGSYDTITLPALSSAFFWCDGTYWYVMGNMNPAAS